MANDDTQTKQQSKEEDSNQHHPKKKVPKEVKTFKLRLRPNAEQKEKLRLWSGCLRYTYNKAIGLLATNGNTFKTPIALQNRLVVASDRATKTKNNFFNNKAWLLDAPCAMRKYAVREAKANWQACHTNLKRGNIDHFSKPFKTKKKEQSCGWSWTLEQTNVKRRGDKLYIYPGATMRAPGKDKKQKPLPMTCLGEMRYCSTKQLHKVMPGDGPVHDC